MAEKDFDERQLAWLCSYIRREITWQAIETLLKDFDQSMERNFNNLKWLKDSGAFKVNPDIKEVLKEEFLRMREVWRNPDLLEATLDFKFVHEKMAVFEKKLKDEGMGNFFDQSLDRKLARRKTIKHMTHQLLRVIERRYKDEYGKKLGRKRFEDFVMKKIAGSTSLYQFLFEGKGNPPEDFQDFQTRRNTYLRNLKNKNLPFFEKIGAFRKLLNSIRKKGK